MLQFEEYKVKLNNLKPDLDDLYQSLGLKGKARGGGAGDQILPARVLGQSG